MKRRILWLTVGASIVASVGISINPLPAQTTASSAVPTALQSFQISARMLSRQRPSVTPESANQTTASLSAPDTQPSSTNSPVPISVAQQIGHDYCCRIWGPQEWPSLYELWRQESGWDYTNENPDSHAYGIPQAMPIHTETLSPEWRNSPELQIAWGCNYILYSVQGYGTPSAALAHKDKYGWY